MPGCQLFEVSRSNSTTEIFLHGQRIKLPVRDPHEYLQRHWARGEIYEHGLFGTDPIRRAAGAIASRVSKRVRGQEWLGMLGYIETRYRGGTFLDVGACIGNHSLFFAVACAAEHVIAFEPSADLAAYFREVMKLNGLEERVELIEMAAGEKEGTVRFEGARAKNIGMGKVSDRGVVEVPVTTIDRVIRERKLRDIALVKIDVEGYNVPVLRGARRMLEARRPDVFVESEDDLSDVDRELDAMGYYRRTDIVFNKTPTHLYVPK